MVHRPADSRLLTNVLSHEKEYAKQLQALLASSHASLASFTAYAAASPPPTSQTILKVAGILSATDSALDAYAAAVDQWRETMRALQALEDEVGNIVRDREILVTRLIKVSKSQKSMGLSGQRFASSSSLASVDTPSPSPQHSRAIATSTKIAAAQSELQACEMHLATKENELAQRRTVAVRDGLSVRCQALVQCGWAWTELGKEAIGVLESPELAADYRGAHRPRLLHESFPHHDHNRPLPPHQDDHSSLGPSRSASQIHLPNGMHAEEGSTTSLSHYSQQSTDTHRIQIPAAHAIDSELAMPMPVMDYSGGHKRDSSASTPRMLSPQSRRDSWMSGSTEWRFETPLQSFSELPLPQTPTHMEEQRPQRPSQVSTPQRRSFIEGNHRMSRSETQLFLQDQPTQTAVQSHRRSTSVDRQASPAPRVRPLSQSWTDVTVPGPSSAPVITHAKSTSSMFTGGPTLFASAEGAHNTDWENVAANATVASGSGPALTQPSRNERPTSVPRTSPSPPAGRVSPTKRGSSLFAGGPALYTATAPAPISAEAAAAFEPSSSGTASETHKSTLFTGGPTLYVAAPPPLDTSNYASTTNYASTSTANRPTSTSNYGITSTSTLPPSSYTTPTTHVLSRRITEEELRSGNESGTEGGSSVDEGEKEDDVDEMIREGRLGIVENPRFSSSLPPPVNVPLVLGGAVTSQGQAREAGEAQAAGGAPQVQTQELPRASADEARAPPPTKVVTGGVFGRRFSGFRNGQKRGRAASDAGSVGHTHVRSESGVVGPQTTEPSQETSGAPVSVNEPATQEQANEITPPSVKGSSSPSKSKFMGSLRLLFSVKPHGPPAQRSQAQEQPQPQAEEQTPAQPQESAPSQPQLQVSAPSQPQPQSSSAARLSAPTQPQLQTAASSQPQSQTAAPTQPRQRAPEGEDAESVASSDDVHFPAPSRLVAHDNPDLAGRSKPRRRVGAERTASTLQKSNTKSSPSKPSVLSGLFGGSRRAESVKDSSPTKVEIRTYKNVKSGLGPDEQWLADSSDDEVGGQKVKIYQGHLPKSHLEPVDLREVGQSLEARYRGDPGVGEIGFGASGAPVPLVPTQFREQEQLQEQRKRRESTATETTIGTQRESDAVSGTGRQGGRKLKKSRTVAGGEGKDAKGKSETALVGGNKKVKNKQRSSSTPPGNGNGVAPVGGGDVQPVPAVPVAANDAAALPKPKEKEVVKGSEEGGGAGLVRRRSTIRKKTKPTVAATTAGGGGSSTHLAASAESSNPASENPSSHHTRSSSHISVGSGLSNPPAGNAQSAGSSVPLSHASSMGISHPGAHSRVSAGAGPPHAPLNVAAAGLSRPAHSHPPAVAVSNHPGTSAASHHPGTSAAATPHHPARPVPHHAATASAEHRPPPTVTPSHPATSAPAHHAATASHPSPSAPFRPAVSAAPSHQPSSSAPAPHHAATSTAPPTISAPPSRPTSVHAHSSSTTVHVLPAGGEHPSGTLSSGGWGGTRGGLSRQSSVLSASSAPIGVEKGKAHATLGQGMGVTRRASVGGVPKDGSTPPEGQKPKHKRSSSMDLGSSTAPTFVPVEREKTGPSSVKKTSKAEKKSSAPPRGLSHVQSYTHFPPAGTTSTSESLMSIVENVARGNRQSWDTGEESVRALKYTGGMERPIGTMQVEVVRAPPRMGREALLAELTPNAKAGVGAGSGARTRGEGMPEVPRAPPPVTVTKPGPLSMPSSEPPSRERPKAAPAAHARRSDTNVGNRPSKSPLRSALKSPSRDPSPHARDAPIAISAQKPQTMPPPIASSSVPIPPSAPASSSATQGTETLAPSLSYTEASGYGKGKGHEKREGGESDGVSISSYETGHEVFVPDGHEVTRTQSTPNGSANPQVGSSDVSSSLSGAAQQQPPQPTTESESTSGQVVHPPRRRKSVRVSLQPTFSPTPPAIDYEDDEDEDQKHAPWKPEENQASTSQLPVEPSQPQSEPKPPIDVHKDMWADSDDEDDEYKNAKLLLARAARKTSKRT